MPQRVGSLYMEAAGFFPGRGTIGTDRYKPIVPNKRQLTITGVQ